MTTRPAIEPAAGKRRDFLGKLGMGLGILAGGRAPGGRRRLPRPGTGRRRARRRAGHRRPRGRVHPGVGAGLPGREVLPGAARRRRVPGALVPVHAPRVHGSWNEQRRTFPCPCHASTFDERGDVLAPPATRALDLFPVVIEAGIVKVDTSRRIERARFEPGQVTYL